MNIAVTTTFPNNCWNVYAEEMLKSFVKYWPAEIPILIALDDDLLLPDVRRIIRPQDAVLTTWSKEHKEFVERNKSKDDPANYRKQPVRFCHKVFTLKWAADAAEAQRKEEPAPRYLIWLDADVLTTKPVTFDDLAKCLPKEGDAVAYLGRIGWEHSECGWLAFDLESQGNDIIQQMHEEYVSDHVLGMEQQHDSWVFDRIIKKFKATNLTINKPGMEIWPQSPMAAWSIHYKGPIAKQKLGNQILDQQAKPQPGSNFVIQTRNAIPEEQIRAHIEENQRLIKNWVRECEATDEQINVVSAGPLLIAEDLLKEKGKIIAVKHALLPLKKAGIKPWACILLDPREHVGNFVKDADPEVIWFVASQVNPAVTKELLLKGCEIWGYHASVNANEGELTNKQPDSVIYGGSATATRGLFLLYHLGFRNIHLYGYDLSFPDKMDLNKRDEMGQPKYMEFSVGMKNPYLEMKRCFYTEGQLMAQFEEMNDIIKSEKFKLEAFGDGIIPFMVKMANLTNLRKDRFKGIMGGKLSSYKDLWKINKSLTTWQRIFNKIRRKPKASTK